MTRLRLDNTSLTGMIKATGYGLRVEDRDISLNCPDVVNIVGVFESIDTSNSTLDKITLPSGLSLNTNAILGEKIVGATSDAVAQVAGLVSSTEVEIVYFEITDFVAQCICRH